MPCCRYAVVQVQCELYDGRVVTASTLQGRPPSLHNPSRHVAPSKRYVELLREGAWERGRVGGWAGVPVWERECGWEDGLWPWPGASVGDGGWGLGVGVLP